MDWMLTDEEIAEIEHDSHDICSRCEGDGQLWADGKAHYPMCGLPTRNCPNCDGTGRVLSGNEGRAIARAAARKVVEWLEKDNLAGTDYIGIAKSEWMPRFQKVAGYRDGLMVLDCDLFVDCDKWQALKQEVGL